ncbi:uncharacterized protein N7479_009345 [Penicillium vulpinum]|uniref:Uncharacterized protein n=1 Tax=Penicillium vulpinum TaxID=29845 RepID=A0A1V6RU69_9EURO|nr:uncharacterized protein N7479_009345 [Penicillium vulpinum]KAJ5950932.1 hypothetical protein N7479_009345 [Penicillium vulpinum]OQE05317.1 hypothetical protein PENVUL_c025G02599 [Penicillium vulpinum]
MMRSGLHKPGALPLLILIVFSLLTLVPSLPNLYHSKFADFSFYTGAARQVPLLQDSVTELTQKAHPLNEPRKSWVLAASHRSRGNRTPLTARVGNAAVVPASETTAVANRSRLSSTHESSFSFGRRARAFRTYFIQQLDDYPFLTSFSNRSGAAGLTHPYTTITINESLPTSDKSPLSIPPHNYSSESIQGPLLPFSASLRDMCQQACHVAIDFGKRVALHGANYAKSFFVSEQITAAPTTLIPNPTIPNASNQELLTPSEQEPPQQKVGADDSTDAAAGRHSQELHGSCMAVVIGLIAGIMWF